MTEFSYYLHCLGIKSKDITVEQIEAPEQAIFNKKQISEMNEAAKMFKQIENKLLN